MIVTTAGRTNEEMVEKAQYIARDLNIPFIERKKEAIKEIQEREEADVLVVGKNRLEIHAKEGADPIFFHPNSAMFRAKRILNGESEPFLEATKLRRGMSFLDCTLGLASDSIIASLAAGEEGRTIGLEGNRFLAYLVKRGLQEWQTDIPKINEAMERIQVVHKNFEAYLHCCPDNCFDVVYFDPMFPETIEESDGIKGLRQVALYSTLTEDVVNEAKRVAKQRIVLKDHWQSPRFERYGFNVYRRKTAKFHFGVIELV
ncbi:class I SAM-dependent methyltransferase [Bacillus songklensis]|uniref:Class I SAM-dependent methyltransferase n=1 Tax=Bacillus songklensis TaxID=1069116 RepID=A0ABV8B6T9_9BACI